jgi:hypothetical protein
MSKRYEFYGTHYRKNNKIMASTFDEDDDTVVMYVNQEKIYEGDVYFIYDGIVDWLDTNATVSNKYALVDWCNSWGDPLFEDSDVLPDNDDLAETVAWLIIEQYKDYSGTGYDFYLDGAEYINMEVFPKSDEVEIV